MSKSYRNTALKKDLLRYSNALKKLKKYDIGNKTVGDIGEHFAQELWGIRLISDRSNPSIDGIDKTGKRVQIKTRHRHEDNEKVHVFRPFNRKTLKNLDYALLIILDEAFWINEVWRVERTALKKSFDNNKSDSFNLTSGAKLKDGVKRVY